jgi:hypothetical protein
MRNAMTASASQRKASDPTGDLELIESEEITCEGLDLFLKSSKQLLRSMEILANDLALIENGKQIVFALDFSEIFTYLFPEKSSSQSRQTARLLINSEKLSFTFLPGTTVELVRALARLIADNRTLQNRLTRELLGNPFVNAFLKYFSQQSDQIETHLVGESRKRIADQFANIDELSGLVARLVNFKNARNFPLS